METRLICTALPQDPLIGLPLGLVLALLATIHASEDNAVYVVSQKRRPEGF